MTIDDTIIFNYLDNYGDECLCMCHKHGPDGKQYAMHCFPCCDWCEKCERRIIESVYQEHLKRCQGLNEVQSLINSS